MPKLDLPGGHVVFLDALPVFPEEPEYRYGDRSDDLFYIWEAEGVKSLASWIGNCLPGSSRGVQTSLHGLPGAPGRAKAGG